MPKINCIKDTLNEICLTHCSMVDICPADAECYYRIQMREIIENIRDDNTDNGVDEA